MADGERREGESGWLPPEPPGRAEGEEAPASPETQPQPTQPTQPQHPPQPQPGAFPPPPPPGQAPPPPAGYGHPPQPQPGYGHPPQGPPGWPPPGPQGAQPAGWGPAGYAPAPPPEPGNGEAVAGFVLGIASLVLLLVTFGFSTIVSLACSVVAIFLGRNGKRKVDRHETRKHRGLAQAGFITGLIGAPLAILATIAWVLVFLSDDFQQEFEDSLDESRTSAAVRAGVTLLAVAGRSLFA